MDLVRVFCGQSWDDGAKRMFTYRGTHLYTCLDTYPPGQWYGLVVSIPYLAVPASLDGDQAVQ
jgi:hypothetical protein